MDGEELELFERSLRHATASATGAELDAALVELGWHDALEVDRRASVALLFGLQGEAGSTSAALDHLVATATGLAAAASTGVVLPAIDRWDPPGVVHGRTLQVAGLVSSAGAECPEVVVAATAGDALVAATVPTESLGLRPVHGVDPWLGLHQIPAREVALPAEPTPVEGSWTDAVAAARLALAQQLVGTSRTMLRLAREHALDRVQFGQPIAGFQAVRHRLAETLVAIETAEAMIDAAWLDGDPGTAAMAKAVAGREARVAAKHCQQVLAGIGFTTEHDLHRFVRRALVLNGLFGSAKSITSAFGAELVESRQLPPLLPL